MKRVLLLILLLVVAAAVFVAVPAYFLRNARWLGGDGSTSSGRGGDQPIVSVPDLPPVADPPVISGPVIDPPRIEGREVEELGSSRRQSQDDTYEIKPGDTIFEIAVARYGDSQYVDNILRVNPGLDPQRIRPGQRIVLPPKAGEGQAAAQVRRDEPKVYVVRPGDTLIAIARREYGDSAMYQSIYELNRDVLPRPESLRPGMRLRLPPPPQY